MRHIRPILALAVLACAVPALASDVETERVHKVVPLGAEGTLELHNFSGHVSITGADVTAVTIDAVRKATRDRLDRIRLDIASSDNRVTIEANKRNDDWHDSHDNVVQTDFDIQVPRRARLQIKVFSSPVRVTDVTGEQSIHTFSGEARVEGAVGRVLAKTFSGVVDVRMASGAPAADVDLETFSGDIALRVPAGSPAAVSFKSFSGKLTSDVPLTLHEQRRGTLEARLEGAKEGEHVGSLRLKTFSGDVKIVR